MRSNAGMAKRQRGHRLALRQLQVGDDFLFILWGMNGKCRDLLWIVWQWSWATGEGRVFGRWWVWIVYCYVRPSSLNVNFSYHESSCGCRVGTMNATDKRHLKFHETQAGTQAQQAVEVRSGRPSLLKNVVKRYPNRRWRHSRRFVKQTNLRLIGWFFLLFGFQWIDSNSS